jgi:phosphatidylinositol alpha 1,6-mannosyltransferase
VKRTSSMSKFDAPVLLATNTFGRLGGEVNGVARTCQQLASSFRDAGVPLEILTYGSHDAVERDGCVTIRIHRPRLPVAIDPSLVVDPMFAFGSAAAAIARSDYSVVHSTTPDPLGRFAASFARGRNIPLVAGYHTAVDEYVALRTTAAAGRTLGWIASRAMRLYLRDYYRRADLVLAPSRTTAEELRRWLSSPIRTLGRGVDSEEFNPRHRTEAVGERPRAIYVGRVAVEKGLDSIVPIFDRHPEISLTVVGEGPQLADMKRRLPTARYMGKLSGPALAREYANADFFVFPSTTDTFGNVVLEAMSSGLPVIVTDRGGPSEIVRDGVNGFVLPVNDFERAIVQMAGDAALRARLASSARATAVARRWPAILDDLLEIYAVARRLVRVKAAARGARLRTVFASGELR